MKWVLLAWGLGVGDTYSCLSEQQPYCHRPWWFTAKWDTLGLCPVDQQKDAHTHERSRDDHNGSICITTKIHGLTRCASPEERLKKSWSVYAAESCSNVKNENAGWRDDSAVSRVSFSRGGLEFRSQHPVGQLTTTRNSSSSRSIILFWLPRGLCYFSFAVTNHQ